MPATKLPILALLPIQIFRKSQTHRIEHSLIRKNEFFMQIEMLPDWALWVNADVHVVPKYLFPEDIQDACKIIDDLG